MRLIDADALEPYYRLMQDNATGMKMMALPDGVVDQQPTVDAVPVIRCKDCKYRDEQSANCTRFRKDWYVQSNSFCSWAEREEE